MPQINIYEINTATWLHQLSQDLSRQVKLSDVPSEEWDRLASYNCQAIWLMGVWQRSPAAIEINRRDENFAADMAQVLTDFNFDKDVIGSAYSIRDYSVSQELGGDAGLAVAREELKKRGMKLILDFVPNHVALDHPWATEHPEYFVQGSEQDLSDDPDSYAKVGDHVIAKGRDPQFDAWSDVLQLNVFSPAFRQQAVELAKSLAERCDGLRCDMAMLLLNDIFSQTWQDHVEVPPENEYWTDVINAAKQACPDFIFMAEAYWNTQSRLIELGFDYCYDKTTYDYLVDCRPDKLKEHLLRPPIQENVVHFLENHDEPRAAEVFSWPQQQAGAILINSLPGGVMYYEGQFSGRKLRTPVQLGRDPHEPDDSAVTGFYQQLISLNLRHAMSDWQLLPNRTHQLNKRPSNDCLAFSWRAIDKTYVSLINWGDREVQTRLELKKEPSSVLYSQDQKPHLEFSDSQLRCQLASWQAIVLQFDD